MNLREPAAFAEANYLSTRKEKGTSPAEVKQRDKTAQKWAEIAMGYRALTEERKSRFDKFEAFISDRLVFTNAQYDSDLHEVEDPGMDCYICVTDVIWQPWSPEHSFDRGFMLGSKAFEGKPKIAYAPSRGAKPDFAPEQAKECIEYVEDIGSISARELDFSRYIEEGTGRSVPTVVDPVLLHDGSFWRNIAVKPKEQRYLLLYYVMERATDTVSKAVEYAKAHDLTIIELSDRPLPYGKITDPDVNHIARYDVSAEEWLGYIAHADAVFTNSFHGCCFSTIFERLFFVGKRNGNKVPNFLSEYGLTGQQFSAADSVEEFADTIDFTRAMERLKELRRSSEAFILDALSAAESSIAARTHEDDDKYRRRRREITFSPHFHSGTVVNSDGDTNVTVDAPDSHGKIKVKKLKSRALEYSNPNVKLSNTGEEAMYPSLFRADGHEPIGWTMRFRIDNRWFWYLEDGKVMAVSTGGSELEARKKILADGSRIPQLPVNHISTVVFVAVWQPRYFPSLAEPRSNLLTRLKKLLPNQ